VTSGKAFWDETLECAPAPALEQYQWSILQRSLGLAQAASLFYRKRWAAADVDVADLASLSDYQECVPFFRKSDTIADQQAHPPYGSAFTADSSELARLFWAPGPEVIALTHDDFTGLVDAGANALYTCGVRPADIIDITAAYNWVMAGTLMDSVAQRLGAAAIPGGAGMSKTHIDVLVRFGCTVLWGFPTFLRQIAREAIEQGIDPTRDMNVRLAIFGGERFSDEERVELEALFGMKTRELYGVAEVPWVAAECSAGKLHVNPMVILEVINSHDGSLVDPGQGGEIVLTDLSKTAQPIFRFRTGDLTASFDINPCVCGRTTSRIGRIIGRVGGALRVKGVFVFPDQVRGVLEARNIHQNFQLVATREKGQDVLTLRLESDNSLAANEQQLVEGLKAQLRASARIEWIARGSLEEGHPVIVDKRFAGETG
jgi:phenylacetate-CoA ligase